MKIYSFKGKSNISGERIKASREKSGLTQEQLAARLQVDEVEIGQKAISRIETGIRVVPDYELPAFAKALNVSVLWLLGFDS